MRLRLRLVWENSSWETTVSRPRRMEPNYEVSFSGAGEISLNRGKGATQR
jgi:poly(glycerol-phosphate) alpha-glucosyltransferase